MLTPLQKLQGDIRSVLISPCRRSKKGERVNAQALIPSWPKRKYYESLFHEIETTIPGNYSISEKIRLILYHEGKNPAYCFDCGKKETSKTKYGTYCCKDCIQSRKLENTRKTNRSRYGVDYQISSKQTRTKIVQTFEHRYGVSHNMKVEEFAKKQGITKQSKKYTDYQRYLIENPEILYKEYISEKLPVYAIAKKYEFGTRFLLLLFKKHDFDIVTSRGYSHEQTLFANKLRELFDVTIVENVRNIIAPKEIDIWIPDANIGIEYHGIYWHSGDEDNRCREKYKLALDNDIELLQFFDFEVDDKIEIIFSIIRSKLNKNESRLNGRDCVVKRITNREHKDFCNRNHLQGGNINTSVALGLFYKNDLVSVMSFGKSRYNKNYEWELLRYSCIPDTTVRGGASKLLTHFERNFNPTSICSYSDCRYSVGNLYENLGFNFKSHPVSNYFYIKDDTIVKRYQAQKHKLHKLLGDNFDKSKTEKENMQNNGYVLVKDAGNKLYGKHYDQETRSCGRV